jgi:hypothetical protein
VCITRTYADADWHADTSPHAITNRYANPGALECSLASADKYTHAKSYTISHTCAHTRSHALYDGGTYCGDDATVRTDSDTNTNANRITNCSTNFAPYAAPHSISHTTTNTLHPSANTFSRALPTALSRFASRG